MGLLSIFKKSTVLYYPGCTTYFKNKNIYELYQKIFNRLDIDYKIIEKKICCGIPALESGYDSEARKLARRNFEIFKEEEITSIITNSPCCYKMFLIDYPKILPDWNIEPRNIWRMILTRLIDKPGLIKHKADEFEIVAYQDSCYLGRYCEIYDEPREILKLLGYNLKEIPDFKSEAICCGSCGGLPLTNPKLADTIAKQRIMQAKRAGINKIIVLSLNDYELLEKNSEGTDIKISELSEVLGNALGMLKKYPDESIENIRKDSEELKILTDTKNNMNIQDELKEDYYTNQEGEENDN